MTFTKIDLFLRFIFVLVYVAYLVRCDFILRQKKNTKFAISGSRSYFDESYVNQEKAFNRQQYPLPVTFHPPPYLAYDSWKNKYKEQNHNRNTFFDFSSNDEKTTYSKEINNFDIRRPLFEENPKVHESTKGIYFNNHRYTTSAPLFKSTSSLEHTEPHYIPPPKPIRASVIKLETIARPSYAFPPNDYYTAPKYYPHVESLLNQVLIENLKIQHQLGSNFDIRFKNNPFINSPIPVLSKPPSYTTVRPEFSSRLDDSKKNNIYNRQKYMQRNEIRTYPKSLQDQLLPLKNVKLPYVYQSTISSFLETPTPSTESRHSTVSNENQKRNNFIFLSDNDDERRNNDDIKILNRYRIYPPDNLKTAINNATTKRNNFVHLINSTQNLQGYKTKAGKPYKASVEIVSNLTVNGLSTNGRENANIQNYINFYNRKNLIPYKTGKSTKLSKNPISKPHPVNLNDELSLDAKILKDTNWDGFKTIPIETTLPTNFLTTQSSKDFRILPSSKEIVPKTNVIEPSTTTTTIPIIQLEIRKVNDFWETEKENNDNFTDIENDSKNYNSNKVATTTTTEYTVTTTEIGDIATTTEALTLISTPPTSPIKETTIVFSTDATTISQNLENDSNEEKVSKKKKNLNEFLVKQISFNMPLVTEDTETTTVTKKPSTRKLSYRRRPVTVFTSPRPFSEKPVINRNYFSRREKPNITLAFGNKNIVTRRPNYKREEMLHFSDENGIRKRRKKSGKRRGIYQKFSNTTSEILLANDTRFVAHKK